MTTITRRPLYAVSEFTTPHNTFAQDVEQVARTGGDGLSIWESKLGPRETDEASIALLRDAGLRAGLCVPTAWSVFSSRLSPTPETPEERAEAIVASIGRLAAFDPVCVLVTPGSAPGYDYDDAMAIVRRSMTRILEAAAEHDVTIGLEPIRASSGGFIHSLEGTLALRDALGDPRLKLIWDVWHGWDEPDVRTLLTENVDALIGVQVNDWREPPRVWTDRLLPGDGVADVVGLLRTIEDAGYEGWYDLEVFSDDGSYVERLPDSLWLVPHEEMLQTAREKFLTAWQQATAHA